MRVAYLINEYPKVSHSFVRREIDALEAQGIEVDIYSIRPWAADLADDADRAHAERTTVIYEAGVDLANALKKEMASNGASLLRTTNRALRLAKNSEKSIAYWSAYVAEAARFRQLLAERPVDHVHAHFGTNSAAVAMITEWLGGPSFSFTVHGPEEFDRQVGLSLPEKIENAAFVVAISSFGRSQLLRMASPATRDNIHVVHCGLDNDFLSSKTHPIDGRPELVTVGRLSEQKGHWVLLEAASMLNARAVPFGLNFVGDGELRPDIEALIEAEGLASNVQITGWASSSEVRAAITRSRALVLPSFAEGLPVVIMEAFAMARPVISTYVAGIPELVVPNKNGWLVPAGEPELLAEVMQECLEAPAERLDEMGRDGAEAVSIHHDAATEAAKLAELFSRAVAAKSSSFAAEASRWLAK